MDKVYVYPSLGGSFSMKRYLDGLISGLQANKVAFEVVRPNGSGLKAKYIDYPLLTWEKKRNKGKHVIISERYAYLVPFMHKDSIVVCHDLHTLYPQAKTPQIHQRLYRFFLNKMFQAKKVVCISNHTKNDLLKFAPQFSSHPNVKVVHNGIEEFWIDQEKVETGNYDLVRLFQSKRILLSIGTDAWYKNNQWSLNLMAELPEKFHLLRIGPFNSSNERLIQDLAISNRLSRVENLSDSDLKYCYQNAQALLFPSISEGFGWPALEAALNNCVVISDGAGATKEFLRKKTAYAPINKAKKLLLSGTKMIPEVHFQKWESHVIECINSI
jgi:glycosyltransferase involved in cell wall biosynthesis